MITEIDIKNRILEKYGQNSFDVFKLLEENSIKHEHINTSRIIRCILFLSEDDIEKLKIYINAAIKDPRDVIFWAEYKNIDDIKNTKKVRDFDKFFEESVI